MGYSGHTFEVNISKWLVPLPMSTSVITYHLISPRIAVMARNRGKRYQPQNAIISKGALAVVLVTPHLFTSVLFISSFI